MHTNHRRCRRRSHAAKREGQGSHWPRAFSFRWYKVQAARARRREERWALGDARWDALPGRYPRYILWNYW